MVYSTVQNVYGTRIRHAEPGRLGEHVGVAVGARRVPEAARRAREHAGRGEHVAREPADEHREHHLRARTRT